ncbi:MAG: fatty acid desaturase [Geminicoccaceae bacterium]
MSPSDDRVRAALAHYVDRSTPLALALFAATFGAYAGGVIGSLLAEPWWLRLVFSTLAGGAIASLFVIGHDAAHGAYTADRRLNGLLGRLAFLPTLHNFSLWQVVHNRLHHVDVNVQGLNSWSPFCPAEFKALPAWRRLLERIYRTPFGLGLYYAVERWWRDKFFPRQRHTFGDRQSFLRGFLLVAAFGTALVIALGTTGALHGGLSGAVLAVLYGFGVPFLVWTTLMGGTVYLQHTSPRVPWFRSKTAVPGHLGQQDVTLQIQVPRWYGLISHHIMDHPAHHVHPKIPLYRLPDAQATLARLQAGRVLRARFTLGYLLDTMRRCQLYDYERHRWLDFKGRITSPVLVPPAPVNDDRQREAANDDAA